MRTHLMLAGVLLTASAIGAAVPAGAQTSGSSGDKPPPVVVTGAPTPTPSPTSAPGADPSGSSPGNTVAPRSRIPSYDSDYQPGLSNAAPTSSVQPPEPAATSTTTTTTSALGAAVSSVPSLSPLGSIPTGTADADAGAGVLGAAASGTENGDAPAPKALPATGQARNAAPLGTALLAIGLSWLAASRRPRAERQRAAQCAQSASAT